MLSAQSPLTNINWAKTKHWPQQLIWKKKNLIYTQTCLRKFNMGDILNFDHSRLQQQQSSAAYTPSFFCIIHFNCLSRNLGFGFCENTTPKLLQLEEWHGFTSGRQKQFLVCEEEQQPKQLLSCVVLFQPVKQMQKISSRKNGAEPEGEVDWPQKFCHCESGFRPGTMKVIPSLWSECYRSTFNLVEETFWSQKCESSWCHPRFPTSRGRRAAEELLFFFFLPPPVPLES